MAAANLVTQATAIVANTSAAPNTLVYRDNQAGVTNAAETVGLLTNTGAEFMALTALKTSAYSVAVPTGGTGGDRVVRCNPTGGAFPVNLPIASTCANMVVTVKNASSSTNAITITPNGDETIDGAGSLVINSAWGYATLQSDGSNWLRIG